MVSTTTTGIYSSFQASISSEEGPQSSEEGSGLHSPNFGPYSPSHSDSFRYHQHDQASARHSTAILPTAFDYSMSLNVQQPPLLDTPQEHPNSNVTYPSQYQLSLSPRNHLAHDFPISHHATNSRVAHTSMDFQYASSSARPLPGGMSHDPSYPRQMGNNSAEVIQDEGQTLQMPTTTEQKEASKKAAGRGGSREPRKEISNVVIACRQCRGRKIRCDSTRPNCNNCVRRSNKCEYDPAPKRRGPDKRPGTRQRSCKKRPADGAPPPTPKRRRTTTEPTLDSPESPRSSSSMAKENLGGERGSSPPSAHAIHLLNVHPPDRTVLHPLDTSRLGSDELSPTMVNLSPSQPYQQFDYDQSGYAKSSFPRRLDTSIMRSPEIRSLKSPMSPAVKHDRRKWWSNFLTLYSLRTIQREITYLFEDTGYWLCFLNLNHFLKRLADEEGRLSIQPAFIYASLAMATLMKSSEVESKAPGRERALWLRNNAQISLQVSWSSGWIDATLAEAAFVLALYEASAHPHYTPDRAEDSLVLLDNIIRRIDLVRIDASDSEVCIFPTGCVPIANFDVPNDSPDQRCSCIPPDSAQPPNPYTTWSYPLPWDPSWTDEQIYQEECRRLCWSSLSLICNHVSQCVAFDRIPPEFYLADSGNYALLFPGEVLDRMAPAYRATDSISPKESIWALYCRSMLLWSFTNRMRTTLTNTDEQVDQIYDAWQEAQALYDSVAKHSCNLDTALLYMCREFIHNTQITVTHTLRSLQGFGNGPPIFKRKHAEDWLRYQDRVMGVVKSAIGHLGTTQGYQLTRRPYQMTWFFNQLSICLVLWNYDRTLKNALTLAKSILVPVEVMNGLWPCHLLQRQAEDLRERLIVACTTMGIDPPPPLNYTLPAL